MKTLVAMVSIGTRREYAARAWRRLESFAHRHGYAKTLVSSSLLSSGSLPHYEKLAVPAAFPDYDRYLIVDDDLYLSRLAPALPEIPSNHIGLVPDPIQANTTALHVSWTGNTGFILLGRDSIDLCAKAIKAPPTPEIWGVGDQGALNHVAWLEQRIHALDPRWNHLPVIHHITHDVTWERWIASRPLRMAFYARLLLPTQQRRAVLDAWGLHLVRAPGRAAFFDRLLPSERRNAW